MWRVGFLVVLVALLARAAIRQFGQTCCNIIQDLLLRLVQINREGDGHRLGLVRIAVDDGPHILLQQETRTKTADGIFCVPKDAAACRAAFLKPRLLAGLRDVLARCGIGEQVGGHFGVRASRPIDLRHIAHIEADILGI